MVKKQASYIVIPKSAETKSKLRNWKKRTKKRAKVGK